MLMIMMMTWTLKKSFKVSVPAVYFSLARRKTHLESVLQNVSVCVSHRSLLARIISISRFSAICSTFTASSNRLCRTGSN